MSLERLLLEHELQCVLGRYAQLCDERDWPLIDQIFSADATASYGGWALADRTAILKMLRDNLGGCGRRIAVQARKNWKLTNAWAPTTTAGCEPRKAGASCTAPWS